MEPQENQLLGLSVSGVLKKFTAKPDGSSWTDEEIEAGDADEYLYEKLTIEDGVVVDTWRKEN